MSLQTEVREQLSEKGYSEIIIDSIIEVLEGTLGEVGSGIVLHHLESKYQIKLQDIAEKPELFEEKLRELLGSCGELVLRKTMELSSSKMKYKLGEDMLSFTDYIKKAVARQNY